MPQILSISCSWCDMMNEVAEGKAVYCNTCGHRADKLREECDCEKCTQAKKVVDIWSRNPKEEPKG